jgi:hypothetical protein
VCETFATSHDSFRSEPHPDPKEKEPSFAPQQPLALNDGSSGVRHAPGFSLQQSMLQGRMLPMAPETSARRNISAIARVATWAALEFILH